MSRQHTREPRLSERLRARTIAPSALRVAAYLGHASAREALGRLAPKAVPLEALPEKDPKTAWIDGIAKLVPSHAPWDAEAWVRLGLIAARPALGDWALNDERAAAAVAAAEAWLEDPGEERAAAARVAAEAVTELALDLDARISDDAEAPAQDSEHHMHLAGALGAVAQIAADAPLKPIQSAFLLGSLLTFASLAPLQEDLLEELVPWLLEQQVPEAEWDWWTETAARAKYAGMSDQELIDAFCALEGLSPGLRALRTDMKRRVETMELDLTKGQRKRVRKILRAKS